MDFETILPPLNGQRPYDLRAVVEQHMDDFYGTAPHKTVEQLENELETRLVIKLVQASMCQIMPSFKLVQAGKNMSSGW